jgi:hypothetical protein
MNATITWLAFPTIPRANLSNQDPNPLGIYLSPPWTSQRVACRNWLVIAGDIRLSNRHHSALAIIGGTVWVSQESFCNGDSVIITCYYPRFAHGLEQRWAASLVVHHCQKFACLQEYRWIYRGRYGTKILVSLFEADIQYAQVSARYIGRAWSRPSSVTNAKPLATGKTPQTYRVAEYARKGSYWARSQLGGRNRGAIPSYPTQRSNGYTHWSFQPQYNQPNPNMRWERQTDSVCFCKCWMSGAYGIFSHDRSL